MVSAAALGDNRPMAGLYYFAYGSNMLTARIRNRCPSVVKRTIASASGFTVGFTKHSIVDQSGKAALLRAEPAQPAAIGVVYEISAADLLVLDAEEGPGYERHDDFRVVCLRTGETIASHTYMAKEHRNDLRPYDWYLALVIAGIVEHGIDPGYAAVLRQFRYDVDADAARDCRQTAVEELRRSGHADYAALLHGEYERADLAVR